jgi:hypothetical protein
MRLLPAHAVWSRSSSYTRMFMTTFLHKDVGQGVIKSKTIFTGPGRVNGESPCTCAGFAGLSRKIAVTPDLLLQGILHWERWGPQGKPE